VKLAYDAIDWDSNTAHLSPFFQYTFTTAFDSGNTGAVETNTAVTYSSNAAFNTVSYPPLRSMTSAPFAVSGALSNINIYMHTFALGCDLTKDLTDRVHLVLSIGPTLNLFDTNLTALVPGVAWASSSHTNVTFGCIGQVGVQVDLDANKRWFIEASGNYHWVTPFTATTPIVDAKVQASSWGGELGLGYRF
jgi:hypothetical protein